MSSSKLILATLKKHKVLTFSELQKRGASGSFIYKLTEEGLVIAVGSGIYASSSLDPFVAAVLATAKYYPRAVISGLTALQIHGFGQEYIERIDVDIPRENSIRNKLLRTHRVPKSRLIGIEIMNFHKGKIRIYNRERSLCEAYLIDQEGLIFFKALKRYVASGNIHFDLIQQYDKATRTQVLKHIRQEVADV